MSPDLVERIERDVGRALRRGRNGLRYAAGTSRPKVGQTAKDTLWRRHKAQLWRYRSDAIAYRPPVLIVHSLVSRSYVLDLYPGNSLVAFFRDAGLDVHLLDWGEADQAEADNTLEDAADEYIPQAIGALGGEVTLLGYCFGGVLSLLACARHPELPVRNLVLMATPVDFDGMGAITGQVRDGRLDADDVIDETGNVPPEVVENAFRMLKPTAEVTQYATLWDNLWNDAYVEGYQAMGQWTRDHVPFPGAAFRQTVEQLVRRNSLMDGSLVDLREITCPALNVLAKRDHIVPRPAAEPIPRLLGAGADELQLDAGHVGLVAGRAAAKVTLPGIVGWIVRHSEGGVTIRPPQPTDLDALLAFFARVPEDERTFFKEELLDRATVERWLGSDRGRRGIALEDERVIGYAAVVRLPGWSDHVGEVRLVVDPAGRGQGLGRALARWALGQAVNCGLSKLYVEVVAEQEGAVAMFTALGFQAEGLLRDHVRDRTGALRDLVLLAHPVEDQWAGMSAAGIDEALEG